MSDVTECRPATACVDNMLIIAGARHKSKKLSGREWPGFGSLAAFAISLANFAVKDSDF